jgi:hypothetical protein
MTGHKQLTDEIHQRQNSTIFSLADTSPTKNFTRKEKF